MLGRVPRMFTSWKQVGMTIVIDILRNCRAMFWKIADDKFSHHAAEVGRHEHVFQSRHLLFNEFRIYRS